MSTAVEKYLDSKKIDYRLDGENAVFNCPFCNDTEGKFGINTSNWLGQCFKGSCATKVNEITFKRHYGDSAWVSNLEDEVAQVHTVAKKSAPEVPPDPEVAHKALLEDDELLNYLNDERGLSLETIKLAKLGLAKRKFSDGKISRALTFPYFKGKNVLGIKYKSIAPDPKDFRFTAGRDVGLYMEDNIKKDMESLIIAEGEMDVLALINQGFTNVVGISGADSKKADWADMLDLPKKLYLVLDNDEAGVKGAKTFTDRFGVDRFHIINIPHEPLDVPIVDKHGTRTTINDVNEYFQIGHTAEDFKTLMEEARPFDIEGVTSMDAAFESIIKRFGEQGNFAPKYAFKWPSLTQRAKGIDDGDMIVVLAPGKAGKTTTCLNQCEFMLEKYSLNPHMDVMEMEATELTQKWTAMKLETDIDQLTLAQMKEGQHLARVRQNAFLFTRSHPTNLDDYLQSLIKTKRRYNSGVIVIDNFQILVDLTIGRNNTNNRPAYMSQVSKSIKALAGELKVPIFLISQPKQLQDGQMVGANDSEGSSTLTKDCDIFITLNRNPEAKMKIDQMAALGNFETNQSHSDDVYVQVALSRRSAGGFCTLKIDGAKSLLREYNSDETTSGQKKSMIAGIAFVDDNAAVAI